MNNSIRVPEDKDFVCAFVTSPDSLYEAIETYRNYLDPVEEIEFEHVLLYLLCSYIWSKVPKMLPLMMKYECIEHLVNEKILSERITQVKRCKVCNKLSWVQTVQVRTFLF